MCALPLSKHLNHMATHQTGVTEDIVDAWASETSQSLLVCTLILLLMRHQQLLKLHGFRPEFCC